MMKSDGSRSLPDLIGRPSWFGSVAGISLISASAGYGASSGLSMLTGFGPWITSTPFSLPLMSAGIFLSASIGVAAYHLGRRREPLATELMRAINTPAVSLYYQPIVDLNSGARVGAEALIRWEREGKFESPERFILAAEDAGVVTRVTKRVLQMAADDAAFVTHREHGARPQHLSINISVQDLQSTEIISELRRLMALTNLPASCFWIEITERALLEGAKTSEVLAAIRALGMRVALDDFGTGYSCLSVLTEFKFDILKIDRVFVSQIETGSTLMIEHIIKLGQSLGLDIVAEGVETTAQRDFLRDMGVRYAQGWLYSRPLPVMSYISERGRYYAPAANCTQYQAGCLGDAA